MVSLEKVIDLPEEETGEVVCNCIINAFTKDSSPSKADQKTAAIDLKF